MLSSELTLHDYREVLDGMTEMVCRFQPDGTILYVNRAYCQMFGVTAQDLIGRSYSPVVHPDDLPGVLRLVATMNPSNPTVVIENRVVLPGGDVRWTQWTNRGFFDDDGRLVLCQSAGRDVTDRVNADAELRSSYRRFQFLADASALLASSLDYETTLARVIRLALPQLADACSVTLLNEQGDYFRIADAHVDPDIERRMMERNPHTDRKREVRSIADRLKTGRAVVATDVHIEDLVAMGLDDEQLEFARMLNPSSYILVPLSAHDRMLGILSIVSCRGYSDRTYEDHDVALALEIGRRAATAIENARLYTEVSRADHVKDEFLATLAHELRNPLAALTSALEILANPAASEATRRRALDVARRQTQQQVRLVDDMLDVSRLVRDRLALDREATELVALVRDMVDVHRPNFERKQQQLSVSVPEQPLVTLADAARLRQVLGNLLDNACKYTHAGGQVQVSLQAMERSARIEVTDNGAGIDPALIDRAFEMFTQIGGDTRSGLGLGLSIARRIVELHGGTLRASSGGPGRGATFVFDLPLAEIPTATADLVARQPAPMRPMRLLLVDDNADAADLLAYQLRSWGHVLEVVYDGPTAIERVGPWRPDVIFVDIKMPGMNGYETARAIRALPGFNGGRIVALTGFASEADVARAAEAGFDRHVRKPVDAARLRELLVEFGGGPRGEAEQSSRD